MDKITVLLSTFNGARYLEEQIESILSQKNVAVKVVVRDDGSEDGTLEILRKYKSADFFVIEGSNIGYKKSFQTLIKECPFDSKYYAFCDQDDVWMEDKLFNAISKLADHENGPAIYSSAQILVDEKLNRIGICAEIPIINLGSAIVKNYAVGCTVVFNERLMKYLRRLKISHEYPHDWLSNAICLSVGGVSIYDEIPHINYRQHGGNQIGAKNTFFGKWHERLKRYLHSKHNRGLMCDDILKNYKDSINEVNYKILSEIANYKKNMLPILLDRDIKFTKITYRIAFYIMVLTRRL